MSAQPRASPASRGPDHWKLQHDALIDKQLRMMRVVRRASQELIVLLQDPSTLVQPYALVRNFRGTWKAVRVFWPQLATAAIGLASVVALIALIPRSQEPRE